MQLSVFHKNTGIVHLLFLISNIRKNIRNKYQTSHLIEET